jgi:hypothetical protein
MKTSEKINQITYRLHPLEIRSRKIHELLTYLTRLILSFHIFCVVIEYKTECELSFEDRKTKKPIQIFVFFAKTKALASALGCDLSWTCQPGRQPIILWEKFVYRLTGEICLNKLW